MRKKGAMSGIDDSVHVTASCDAEFVRLLQAYKNLKAIKHNLIICLVLVIMLPFTYILTFACVFALISLLAGIMTYLVISQQQTIDEIQRSLYNICVKSVSEQVQRIGPSRDNDAHED